MNPSDEQVTKLDELESDPWATPLADWTSTQIARRRLRTHLRALKQTLEGGQDLSKRIIDEREFQRYAYQWY